MPVGDVLLLPLEALLLLLAEDPFWGNPEGAGILLLEFKSSLCTELNAATSFLSFFNPNVFLANPLMASLGLLDAPAGLPASAWARRVLAPRPVLPSGTPPVAPLGVCCRSSCLEPVLPELSRLEEALLELLLLLSFSLELKNLNLSNIESFFCAPTPPLEFRALLALVAEATEAVLVELTMRFVLSPAGGLRAMPIPRPPGVGIFDTLLGDVERDDSRLKLFLLALKVLPPVEEKYKS